MHRRDALRTLAAASAALALPARLTAQPRRLPPRLRAGDAVGLVAPAGITADRFELEAAADSIRAMRLEPRLAPNALARDGYLAGPDAARAAGIDAMWADPAVKALFALRGGWGAARVLPLLDWRRIAAAPKLLIGFSDITALHMAIAARAGFPSIHGPNAASAWGKASWDSFRAVAFDGATPTWTMTSDPDEDRLAPRSGRPRVFTPGRAQGRLLGGNLTVLTSLVGTPWLPDFTGAILFIEDVNEAPYRIDRMLTQLALAGILGRLAGVVFGQCTDCRDPDAGIGGFTLSQVLEQHLAPLRVPAFQGAPFGHVRDQVSLPVGCRAEVDADAGALRLLEPAVA